MPSCAKVNRNHGTRFGRYGVMAPCYRQRNYRCPNRPGSNVIVARAHRARPKPKRSYFYAIHMMDYVNESGWPALTRAEQEHWLGAYRAYMEAMTKAGVLKSSSGLQPTASATTVRVAQDPGARRPLCRLERATGWLSYHRRGRSRRRDLVGSSVPNRASRCRRGASSHGGHPANQGGERVHQARVSSHGYEIRVFC